MNNEFRPKCRWPFVVVIIILLVFLLSLAIYFQLHGSAIEAYQSVFTPDPILAPTWNGITPGKSTLGEATDILGPPDSISRCQDFNVYTYEDRDELQWVRVELWMRSDEYNATVEAIYKVLPVQYGDSIETPDILPLIWKYGRPDLVTWGRSSYIRYLIWARYGVAIDIHTNPAYGWDSRGYTEIFLFPPMLVEEVMAISWPWPSPALGFSDHNLFTRGDLIDIFPVDPFDWDTVPTPAP